MAAVHLNLTPEIICLQSTCNHPVKERGSQIFKTEDGLEHPVDFIILMVSDSPYSILKLTSCDGLSCANPMFILSLNKYELFMGGEMAPNLGGTKKFFRGPISGKISIFRVKISDDLFYFLVIDLVLRIFPFFSHIFRMFTMLNVVYDHFLTRKPPFFTLSYFHAHPTTLLLKILGDQCMGRPPPQIFGGTVPPSPPRSPPLSGPQKATFTFT